MESNRYNKLIGFIKNKKGELLIEGITAFIVLIIILGIGTTVVLFAINMNKNATDKNDQTESDITVIENNGGTEIATGYIDMNIAGDSISEELQIKKQGQFLYFIGKNIGAGEDDNSQTPTGNELIDDVSKVLTLFYDTYPDAIGETFIIKNGDKFVTTDQDGKKKNVFYLDFLNKNIDKGSNEPFTQILAEKSNNLYIGLKKDNQGNGTNVVAAIGYKVGNERYITYANRHTYKVTQQTFNSYEFYFYDEQALISAGGVLQ